MLATNVTTPKNVQNHISAGRLETKHSGLLLASCTSVSLETHFENEATSYSELTD